MLKISGATTSVRYADSELLSSETSSGEPLLGVRSLAALGRASDRVSTAEVLRDTLIELRSVGQITSDDRPDILMAQLAQAAETANEQMFVTVYQLIDWNQRTAEAFARAIQWALAAGAHAAARALAVAAVKQHPNSAELQKYHQVLSPPKTLRSHLPADPSIRVNNEWLRTNRQQYAGQWVALRRGTLLAAANSLQELTEQFGIAPDILYTKVF